MYRRFCYWAALVAVVVAPGFAEPGDPPARVARLNFTSGQVSFRPGTIEDWTEASVNFPLTTGDRLWTDAASQSELHIGSTALRMGQTTALAILNLDDRTVQLSLTEGTLNIRVRNLGIDEIYEIDTPNSAIAILRPGDYRFDVDSERNISYATVWDGEADVTGAGATFPLRYGQRAELIGNQPQQMMAAPPPGDFDRWCDARDRREEQSQSVRYVSRETTGYEDLDDYGSWRSVPQYGDVWVPASMPAGWAPYRYGRWAWVDPWGWTWIDEAPWGFAPYHYGRWAYSGQVGWCWSPGPIAPRPVYAPALVAFVGGPSFGVGVAWFPLGPGEAYRPAYRVSDVYARRMNVNVANINVTNATYVNRRAPGAVTVVPREAFVGARPVRMTAMTVDTRMIDRAQIVGSAAPVAPTRVSVLARPEGRAVAAPPARFVTHAVIARTAPPPPPVPFQARERALSANQGRPLEPAQVETFRRAAPAAAPAVRTMAPPQGGFRRPVGGEEAARPAGQPARGTPPAEQVNRPPARGDRPPVGVPAAAPRQVEQRPAPAVEQRPIPQRPEQRPAEQRPAVQQPAARPAPSVEQRPTPQRPAEQQPPEQRPAVQQPAARPQAAPAPQQRQERPQPAAQPRNERPAAAPKAEKPAKKEEGKKTEK